MAINFQTDKKNIFSLVLVLISLIGVWWLTANEVSAGWTYFGIILFFITVLVTIIVFLREEKKDYNLYIPIDSSPTRAIKKFTLGLMIPIIFAVVIPAFGSLLAGLNNPAFVFDSVGQQSFAAVQAMDQPFWQFFTVGFTAGVIEELWQISLWLAGMVIGLFVCKSFGIEKKWPKLLIQVGCAFLLSVIIFVITHTLNPLYTESSMFISAMIFRIIMTFIMYFVLGYEFTVGYHISNNVIFLGLKVMIPALFKDARGYLIILFLIVSWYWWARTRGTLKDGMTAVFKEWAFLPKNSKVI